MIKRQHTTSWLLATCIGVGMLTYAAQALANPEGGVVSGGSADIIASGSRLDIHQHTNRAVIDWRSFNIESGEVTQFHQPTANSIALNRVNDANPSRILGSLSANGNVVLINPNGVFFGKDSVVDVNGMVATTADIDNDVFMQGEGALHFDKAGAADAAIINEGTITAKEAGLVGLVAPSVANHGTINAKLGHAVLASGDTATLDFYGDGLIQVAAGGAVTQQVVVNTGTISAAGGTIQMQAAAGRHIVDSLIVAGGEIKAPSFENKNGRIIIGAEGSNAVKGNIATDKGKKQGASTVLVDAHIDASGRQSGQTGGNVEITGDHVAIQAGGFIDASGDAGGGDIKIGGDYLGTGDTATAKTTYIDKDSLILNDAVTKGDGGKTIIWSDDTTVFHGNIFARGGTEGGNGGFVETSGKNNLDAKGYVNLKAAKGDKGTYLLDPENITIYGSTVEGAEMAYALYQANAAYDGPLIRVRRASDNVEMDIGFDARGNLDEAALSTFLGGSNGYVKVWYDQSGNSRNVSNNNIASQAKIYDGVAGLITDNGKAALSFEGGDMYASAIFNDNFDGASFMWVADAGASNSYEMIYQLAHGSNVVTHFARRDATANRMRYAQLPAQQVAGSTLDNETYFTEMYTNGGGNSLTAYANGALDASGTNVGQPGDKADYKLSVGGPSNTWVGTMSEFIAYNSDESANRHLLEQDHAARYGLSFSSLSGDPMDPATGWSTFTADYLSLLSESADIVLQANNNITLDLKGDNLYLADDKSITLTTTTGDILTASAGTITTNRTGTGGNITFNSGNDITLSHALTFNAQNGGQVQMIAAGDITTDGLTMASSGFNRLHMVADGSIYMDNANISATEDEGIEFILNANRNASGYGAIEIQSSMISTEDGEIILSGGNSGEILGSAADLTYLRGGTDSDSNGVGDNDAFAQGGGSGNSKTGIYISGSTLQVHDAALTMRARGNSGASRNRGMQIINANIMSDGYLNDPGNIAIYAKGGNGGGLNTGLEMSNGDITSRKGDIKIVAEGPGSASGSNNYGLYMYNGSEISSFGNGGQSADIYIEATADRGRNNNHGFYMAGTTTEITSKDGEIEIVAVGADGTEGENHGLYVAGGTISSTGTNGNAGSLTITGTGGNGSLDNNHGIYLTGTDSKIISGYGNITLNGYGAGGSSADSNHGIVLDTAVTAISSNEGVITLNGTNGAGANSRALHLSNATIHSTNAASMIVNATGNFLIGGAFTMEAQNGGAIDINTDSLTTTGTFDLITTGLVTMDATAGDIIIGDILTRTNNTASKFTMNAGNDILVNGEIINRGNGMTIQAGRHLTINDDITNLSYNSAHNDTLLYAAGNNSVNTGLLTLNANINHTGFYGAFRMTSGHDGSGDRADLAANTTNLNIGSGVLNFNMTGFGDLTMNRGLSNGHGSVLSADRLYINEDLQTQRRHTLTGTNGIWLGADLISSHASDAGGVELNGDVTLTDSVTISSTSDSTGNLITFNGDLNADGAGRDLTISMRNGSANAVAFNGKIGNVEALDNLSISANEINFTDTVSGAGVLTLRPYDDALDIELGSTDAARLNLTAADLAHIQDDWSNVVIGDASLFTGNIYVTENIFTGGSFALRLNNAASKIFLGADIATDADTNAGSLNFYGDVELTNNVTLDTNHASGTDGALNFHNKVNADDAINDRTLDIAVGSGNVLFDDTVGADGALYALTVTDSNETMLQSVNSKEGGISIAGLNAITLYGDLDTTQGINAGNIYLQTGGNRPVNIAGNLLWNTNHSSGNDGNITVSQAGIEAENALNNRTLTLNAGDGDFNISGTIGTTRALYGLVADVDSFYSRSIYTQDGGIDISGNNLTFATGPVFKADMGTNAGDITLDGNVSLAGNWQVDADHATGTDGSLHITGDVNGFHHTIMDAQSITIDGRIGNITALKNVHLISNDSLSLNDITAQSILARALDAGTDVTLNGVLNVNGTNNAIVIDAQRNFINNVGAGVFQADNGRWLVYATNPADSTRNGLIGNAQALYGMNYDVNNPSTIAAGNRFLFSDAIGLAPVLTVTADDLVKVSGEPLPDFTYEITGFLPGDDETMVIGTPEFITDVDPSSASGSYEIGLGMGTLTNYLGYQFNLINAQYQVDPAPVASNIIPNSVIQTMYEPLIPSKLSSSSPSSSNNSSPNKEENKEEGSASPSSTQDDASAPWKMGRTNKLLTIKQELLNLFDLDEDFNL